MEDVPEAINVTSYYTRAPEEPVSVRTPVFRNIAIGDMTIIRSPSVASIEGLPEMPVDGLQISNVTASGKKGLTAYNTRALRLHNVEVNAESGPAFLVRDSRELELDGVTTRAPLAGTPAIRLDRCPDTIVRGSRAYAGTGTFLSVAPGESKGVAMEGNVLGAAQKAVEEQAADFWKAAAARAR
jgi:hypothetical protein